MDTPQPTPLQLPAELIRLVGMLFGHTARLLGLAALTVCRSLGDAVPRVGWAVGRRMPRQAHQAGQATAEYALVLLGAAVVAIALVTWATGSGRVGDLFDRVFDELVSRL